MIWSTETRRWYARAAGVGYLTIIVTGIYAEFFVRSGLVVPGDPAATASNIGSAELLFRSGIASELLMLVSDVFVAVALYVVFYAVDRGLAMLAAFFRLAHASVVGVNLLNVHLPLLLLRDGSVAGLGSGVAETAALLLLESHAFGYAIGLVFFAVHCAVLGLLVLRSTFVPRVLGLLLMAAAVGYLTDTLARTLLTDYAAVQSVLTIIVFGPAFVAELSFALWLLGRGGRISPAPEPAGIHPTTAHRDLPTA